MGFRSESQSSGRDDRPQPDYSTLLIECAFRVDTTCLDPLGWKGFAKHTHILKKTEKEGWCFACRWHRY